MSSIFYVPICLTFMDITIFPTLELTDDALNWMIILFVTFTTMMMGDFGSLKVDKVDTWFTTRNFSGVHQ